MTREVKCFMINLTHLFGKKSQASSDKEEISDETRKGLEEKIGLELDITYLVDGRHKQESGAIIYSPDKKSLYFGEPCNYHKIDFSCIESITDGKKEIYRR